MKSTKIFFFLYLGWATYLVSCQNTPSILDVVQLRKEKKGDALCSMLEQEIKKTKAVLPENELLLLRSIVDSILVLQQKDSLLCLGRLVYDSETPNLYRLIILKGFGLRKVLLPDVFEYIKSGEKIQEFERELFDVTTQVDASWRSRLLSSMIEEAKRSAAHLPKAIAILHRARELDVKKEKRTLIERWLYRFYKKDLKRVLLQEGVRSDPLLIEMKKLSCKERDFDENYYNAIIDENDASSKLIEKRQSILSGLERMREEGRDLLEKAKIIESKMSEVYHIRAVIVDRSSIVEGDAYEISFNLWNRYNRAILVTNNTRFNTKGWFSMYAKKKRIMDIRFNDGSVHQIPLYEEFSQGALFTSVLSELNRQILSKVKDIKENEALRDNLAAEIKESENKKNRIWMKLASSAYRYLDEEDQKKSTLARVVAVKKSSLRAMKGVEKEKTGAVYVPAGCFLMGDNFGDRDEKPKKRVCLDAFWMDKTETTVAQYTECFRAGFCKISKKHKGCNGSEKAEHPINCVTWFEAKAYCEWAGKRLPTEAEWEYAARGLKSYRYPWGNAPKASCRMTVMYEGSGGCGRKGTWPVGQKKKDRSTFGVMDMAGNVMEWTSDCYAADFYRKLKNNQKAPVSLRKRCSFRSIRGADWDDENKDYFRLSNRDKLSPNKQRKDLGFRCVQR